MRMTRRYGTRGIAVASSLTLAAMLTGCASSSPTQSLSIQDVEYLAERASELGYEEQAARIEDGEATFEDYDESWQALASCVKGFGYGITDPIVSPVDSLTYEFVFDSKGFEEQTADVNILDCQERHFAYVSQAYLGTHSPRMEPALADGISTCLTKQGIDLAGDEETVAAFMDAAGDRDVFDACIADTAHQLYPSLPTLGWGK